MSVPLTIWICGAAVLYGGAWLSQQRYEELVRAHQEEMRRRSFPVFVSDGGTRYHRESHRVHPPTRRIEHPVAVERGYTPCKICRPVPIRKYPPAPVRDPSIDRRIHRANWSFGLVVLSWVGFCYLPEILKSRLMRY